MQIIFVEKGFSASAKLIHCSHELAHLFAPITKSFYLESKKNSTTVCGQWNLHYDVHKYQSGISRIDVSK